jgi:hypothetical protein
MKQVATIGHKLHKRPHAMLPGLVVPSHDEVACHALRTDPDSISNGLKTNPKTCSDSHASAPYDALNIELRLLTPTKKGTPKTKFRLGLSQTSIRGLSQARQRNHRTVGKCPTTRRPLGAAKPS